MNLLATLLATAVVSPQGTAPVRVTFANTDVAIVLRALASQTGATILYANKEKLPITINLRADSTDQAVRFVAASAGLAVRRIDRSYVVAPETGLRLALAPFSRTVDFPLDPDAGDRTIKLLQDAFPQATVRPSAGKIRFTGVADDVTQARDLFDSLVARERIGRPTQEVVNITRASADGLAKVVAGLFPEVKLTAALQGTGPGGIVALSGPGDQVAKARALLAQLDVAPSEDTVDPIGTRIYTLRYAGAIAAIAAVGRAVPGVEVTPGPESFLIPRPNFRSVNQGALTGGGGGGAGAAPAGGPQGGGAAMGDPNAAAMAGGMGGAMGGQPGGGPGMVPTTDRPKALVLKGRKAALDAAEALLLSLDTKPRQMMVEAAIYEINPTQFEEFGIQTGNGAFGQLFSGSIGGNSGQGSTLRTGNLAIAGLLQAAIESRDARVLARPRVLVQDNDTAQIFIGNTLRIPIQTAGALGTANVTIGEFQVGITLLLAPRITGDTESLMRVDTGISTISAITNGLPQTSNREASTTLELKNGETVVIGGLIQDEDVRTMRRVPLLSQIPLLGELFKFRTRDNRRTEIVLAITANFGKESTMENAGLPAGPLMDPINDYDMRDGGRGIPRLDLRPNGRRMPREKDTKGPPRPDRNGDKAPNKAEKRAYPQTAKSEPEKKGETKGGGA